MEENGPPEYENLHQFEDTMDRSEDSSEGDDDAAIGDEAHCNPEVPDDLAHAPELDVMRGDAIGNTMYSQRFVINALIKLASNDLEMSEEFENNLCTLWDMAIEKDVVHFLQSLSAFDVFTTAINNSDDRRLIEILIGTISNMCNIKEVSIDLASNLQGLINLVTCTDAPTLLQLMRLYWVLFGYLDIRWLDVVTIDHTFVESVCYIFNNSTNKPLVECTMMAVNAVMASVSAYVEREKKKQKQREKEEAEILAAQQFEAAAAAGAPIGPMPMPDLVAAPTASATTADNQPTLMDLFINEEFIESTFMALDLVVENQQEAQEDMAGNIPMVSSNVEKLRRAFLTIHTFMIRNRRENTHVNDELLQRLFIVLNQQLQPYCFAENLVPYAANAEEVLLSTGYTMQQILTLGFPYDITCLGKLLAIYDMLHSESEARGDGPIHPWDDINGDFAEKSVNMREIIIKTVSYAVDTLDLMQLAVLLGPQNHEILMLICQYYDASEKEHYHARSNKIQNAIKLSMAPNASTDEDMGPGAGICVGLEGEDDDEKEVTVNQFKVGDQVQSDYENETPVIDTAVDLSLQSAQLQEQN